REARVTTPSQVNDEVTPDIDRIVLKALAKEAPDRYQTAGEMARDIDALLYNFKPTPTSADLAIYMHHLWSAEPVAPAVRHDDPAMPVPPLDARDLALTPPKPIPAAAPALIDTPMPSPPTKTGTTSPGNVVLPAWDAPRDQKKKWSAVPIAVAAVVLIALAGGFFLMRRRGNSSAQQAATATHTPASTAPAPVPVTTQTETAVTQTVAAEVPQPPALDPNAVNEEVQKRLAAERARLDAQQRAQQQQLPQQQAVRQPALGGGNVGAAIAPRQPPVVQQQATQTVEPPPPVQTNTQPPAPQPQPTATQAVATQPPAPAPAPPPRAREGDLVAAGTEGLVPPRVTRRGTVAYPPIAKQQKIEGTVILNVLVNETGQVLDIKVLRSRPAGLDEAAIAIIRRSTFTPPTKDGVRVKSWTTVPVEFKL
ncbi:MAG TPA: TonB family protein, partial [Thermoanaerobaculia bacterium]|nr:TonB family protein [Thermoanaerobaculia bacterium]